jgi:predicted ATPase
VRLIGREHDRAGVRQLVLRPPGRLVTLTGTGGCGKTQVTLVVAADLVEHFPDRMWFVELAALHEPERIPNAVAPVLERHE